MPGWTMAGSSRPALAGGAIAQHRWHGRARFESSRRAKAKQLLNPDRLSSGAVLGRSPGPMLAQLDARLPEMSAGCMSPNWMATLEGAKIREAIFVGDDDLTIEERARVARPQLPISVRGTNGRPNRQASSYDPALLSEFVRGTMQTDPCRPWSARPFRSICGPVACCSSPANAFRRSVEGSVLARLEWLTANSVVITDAVRVRLSRNTFDCAAATPVTRLKP
jgi:hypothetical protein